jgi:hypothetical protein
VFTHHSLAVLHPRHKLEYFKAQKWEDEWIHAARNIVREEFDRSYASVATSGSGNTGPACGDAMQVDGVDIVRHL